MNTLHISLFGRVKIVHDHRPIEPKNSNMAQMLLAYLLLERRYYPREVLTDLFWGHYSQSRARSCLSTTLWRLRRLLEPEGVPRGTYLLTTATGEVGFNWESDHWLDVAIFEETIRQFLKKPVQALETVEAQSLEATLGLHAGELLEGFYDEWALRKRERLRQLYLKGLTHLMRYYHHHGAYEQSLAYGHQILNHDPLRENIHRQIMRLHWEHGHLALAIRQYQTCCQMLAAELNIAPMEETQALYAQIVSASNSSLTTINLPCLQQALQQLQQATMEFKRAQEKLTQATRLVEQVTLLQGKR